MFLWVLSLLCIYHEKVPVDLVFFFIYSLKQENIFFVWQKVRLKPSILNGSIYVIYFFSTDKMKVHRKLYLHDHRSTCLQTLASHHINFYGWFIFFFSFWRDNVSIKLCFNLCVKWCRSSFFHYYFFWICYTNDSRQLNSLSWTCLKTLVSHHLNFCTWFCSFFHSTDIIFHKVLCY